MRGWFDTTIIFEACFITYMLLAAKYRCTYNALKDISFSNLRSQQAVNAILFDTEDDDDVLSDAGRHDDDFDDDMGRGWIGMLHAVETPQAGGVAGKTSLRSDADLLMPPHSPLLANKTIMLPTHAPETSAGAGILRWLFSLMRMPYGPLASYILTSRARYHWRAQNTTKIFSDSMKRIYIDMKFLALRFSCVRAPGRRSSRITLPYSRNDISGLLYLALPLALIALMIFVDDCEIDFIIIRAPHLAEALIYYRFTGPMLILTSFSFQCRFTFPPPLK